ncbi:MAG: LamG domain-containing protein, partial [Planctomycetes bacterium]|nr:LamG domain-containing protein [Planctomycetota bacterium]
MASFVLVLSATGSASAELIAHWTFDEGSGTTAFDSSGNGHDGTFNGDPTWAAGHLDGALQLDGSGDYLTCGLIDIDTAVTGGLTVCAWINKPAGGDMKFCSNRQGNNAAGGGFTCTIYNDRMEMDLTNASVRNLNRDTDGPTVPADTWVHVSWVYDDVANTFNEYHDGVLADSSTENVSVGISTQEFRIGADAPNLGRYVNGLLDDLRIYNSALSEQEILGVMQGGGVSYPFASRPSPSDGALLEATWANLGWRAGDSAISHNLYFGTNFDDVNESAEGTFVGNLATTNQVVGFAGFPAPDGLQPGTTYYWRIDEVNDANAASPWKGDVWSFWVPPRTAYEPDPADGTSFVMTDATLSWTPGFGATLQYVYFGDDFDDVSSATGTLPQTDSTFAPAALEGDKTYYWRVDEFDGPATHKGDVWSFTTVPEIAVANPNLMLWWTLDEGDGATAVDWSGHGNHGAIVGGAMWIDGYQGTALTFGEDVYVEAAGYDGITGTVPRTCCAWIRTTTANRNIMSWGQNVAGQKWRMRVDATGGLRIEVNGGYHYGVT